MKNSILLFIFFLSLTALGQTAIIAHKSHSGIPETFFTDPSSNFGAPPPRLIQVLRLSDSISIEVYNDMGYIYYDTIRRNPKYANYALNIDSIKQANQYFPVDYINFKDSPDSLRLKNPGVNQGEGEVIIKTKEPIQKKHSKKKKNKAVLFVFLFIGGGLLSLKVLNRKSVVPVVS